MKKVVTFEKSGLPSKEIEEAKIATSSRLMCKDKKTRKI